MVHDMPCRQISTAKLLPTGNAVCMLLLVCKSCILVVYPAQFVATCPCRVHISYNQQDLQGLQGSWQVLLPLLHSFAAALPHCCHAFAMLPQCFRSLGMPAGASGVLEEQGSSHTSSRCTQAVPQEGQHSLLANPNQPQWHAAHNYCQPCVS